MMRRTLVTAAAAAVLTTGGRLDAQACLGRASFSSGGARVGANYRSVSIYGGEIGYGKTASWFGVAQGDRWQTSRAPSYSASWNRVMATAGYQVPLKTSGFEACPLASIGYYFSAQSRSVDSHSDYTSRQYQLGGAIGYSAGASTDWMVVPSFAMQFVRQTSNGTWEYSNQTFRGSPPPYDFGLSTFTLGITKNRFTFSPFLQRPFGIRYSTTHWGLGLGYNVGRK
jgi:hypothetical protein